MHLGTATTDKDYVKTAKSFVKQKLQLMNGLIHGRKIFVKFCDVTFISTKILRL